MGGTIATLYAGAFPEKVVRLVNLEPGLAQVGEKQISSSAVALAQIAIIRLWQGESRRSRHLERVRWANRLTGEEETRAVSNVFCMLGAVPNTEWLDGCVALDDKGFVRCGGRPPAGPADGWDDGRAPFALETSRPGVFAVGDVRSGSVKRVASAVGEGSIAVPYIHQVLAGT